MYFIQCSVYKLLNPDEHHQTAVPTVDYLTLKMSAFRHYSYVSCNSEQAVFYSLILKWLVFEDANAVCLL